MVWSRSLMLVCLASMPILLSSCKPVADADSDKGPIPPMQAAGPEQLYEVAMRVWPHTVRVQGSLLGDEDATISAKISGKIEAVLVDFGDVVRAGEPLVALETHDLKLHIDQAQAQLEQARAAIGLKPNESEDKLDPTRSPPVRLEKALWDEARINLQRIEELAARRATSQQEVERLATLVSTAEARYASAMNGVQEKIALIRLRRAELALAQQALADANITAPFDAVVRERIAAVGEYVDPAQPLVRLVRIDTLRFTAGVPERHAGLVQLGQPVEIQIEGHDRPVVASVTRISPALDLASRSLTIEADVPNPGHLLRSGLFAEAEIIVAPDASVLAVPQNAVIEFAGVEKVLVMQDGKPTERSVRTGRSQEGFVEILEGLAAGDMVVHDDSGTESNTASDASPAGPSTEATTSIPVSMHSPRKL